MVERPGHSQLQNFIEYKFAGHLARFYEEIMIIFDDPVGYIGEIRSKYDEVSLTLKKINEMERQDNQPRFKPDKSRSRPLIGFYLDPGSVYFDH